jgi:hypothetical protein
LVRENRPLIVFESQPDIANATVQFCQSDGYGIMELEGKRRLRIWRAMGEVDEGNWRW